MNKFRKFAAALILTEILMLIGFNFFIVRNITENSEREYKVDICRIASRLENGESIAEIDTDEYNFVSAIHIYDESEKYKNEYEIRKINGEIYLFEYIEKQKNNIYIFNYPIIAIIIINSLLLLYLDMKIITPFSKMESLTTELAKGNLAAPLKQEKSRYFKKYLWGMDMLREKLESDKRRELELLKEKKMLILSLSHDIKTPLSAIDLYVKALKRNLYKTDEEKNAVLSGMENNIYEIKGYMQEIAQASREDIVILETENTEVYLSDIISEIREYYCEKMKNLHVDFKIEDTEYSLIYGDEKRIVEVMQNVIENALKYGDGKEVAISFDEEEDCKLVIVSNSGCTLAKDEVNHIFDSFYRGSNVKNQQGSGLGLYICKELMKKMDGEVFAEIRDGYFVVTLVLRKI